MRRLRTAWISAVPALALLATACGGGGNPLVIADLFASFSANTPSVEPQRISMEPGQSEGEVFSIEIRASGIDDLYGAAFTVQYDSGSATFVGCDSLDSDLVSGGAASNPCDDSLVGGARFSAALQNDVEGVLNVRASLDGLVQGVPAGAGLLLLTLTFEANSVTADPVPFTFDPLDSSQSVQACDLASCNSVDAAFDGGTLITTSG